MSTDIKHILTVEDESDIAELYSNLCSTMPSVNIENCSNVSTAKKKCHLKRFDLIILDINLGNENGGTFVHFLKHDQTHLNINTPIIISSGFITQDFKAKYQSTFFGILQKPFLDKEALSLIKQAL